ncbi:MAG: hypothetical protein K2Q18_02865 [Bdellovibrionales bacterium]|nr:hypothetical protein [Bdellovibrionales bacterium]
MSSELNLVERNQELKRELDAAIELIKRYEYTISEIENQNNATLRKSVHDLSNPLQVLAMTIESLQMKAPDELQPALERMRRSAESMTSIIISMRKLRSAASTSVFSDKKATQVV